jgi:hypothetical protein
VAVSSKEDVKPVPSLPPQTRSAPSRPSPLRNTVLGADDTHHDEQEKAPPQARPRNNNGIVQYGRQPQQVKKETSLPLPGEAGVKPVALHTLQPSDSDLDSYFNDEDNDAFLAVEDSAMHSIESSDNLGTIGRGGQSVIPDANLDGEISRSGPPLAPASVKLPSQLSCRACSLMRS